MPISTINSKSIADGTVVASDILDGTISSSKLVSANIAGDRIAANTLSNTVFQTGSVESYMRAQGTSSVFAGMRNRVINGAMVIDQRNVGTAFNNTTSGVYSADRWKTYGAQAAKFSIQQDSSANTVAGFANSLKVTSLSSYSLVTSDQFDVYQLIEGYNVADLAWGTASAKAITLSFWTRSSLIGTFGGSVRNTAANRSYPFTYTISSADTWEYKTITIPGDTTGTWEKTTSTGIILLFGLGTHSGLSGPAGAWAAANYVSATGATSVVGTNGATWYVTGVQLEAGSTPTPFEYRQYGTELQLCQRYYFRNTATTTFGAFSVYAPAVNGTDVYLPIQFPVTMRISPSSLETANIQVLDGVTTYTGGTFTIDSVSNSPNYASVKYAHGSSVFSQYRTYGYRGNNNAGAYLAFSAEL
jgi:hypothetical protein